MQDSLTFQARELLAGFIESGREHKEQIDAKLRQLENHGFRNGESTARIARNAHGLYTHPEMLARVSAGLRSFC